MICLHIYYIDISQYIYANNKSTNLKSCSLHDTVGCEYICVYSFQALCLKCICNCEMISGILTGFKITRLFTNKSSCYKKNNNEHNK